MTNIISMMVYIFYLNSFKSMTNYLLLNKKPQFKTIEEFMSFSQMSIHENIEKNDSNKENELIDTIGEHQGE